MSDNAPKTITYATASEPMGKYLLERRAAILRRALISQLYHRRRERFNEQTGIAFELGCAIDTAEYRRDWKGVAPICEIVIADFPIPEKVSPQFPQQPLVFA